MVPIRIDRIVGKYMTGGSVVCRAMPITPNVTAHITVAASTNP